MAAKHQDGTDTGRSEPTSEGDRGAPLAAAKALHAAGRLPEAARAYQKLLAARPDDAGLHYAAGVVAQQQGDARRAEDRFRDAVRLRPSFVAAHNNLGSALARTGQAEDAIACFRRALELDPAYLLAVKNLAFQLQKLRRDEEAMAYFDRVLSVQPDFAAAHNGRGVALRDLGRLEDAAAGFQRALAVKPDYLDAAMNLGQTLQKLGRLDDAEAAYRRAVSLAPADAGAVYSVGSVLEEKGNIDAAIKHYRAALDLDPAYGAAKNNLGRALDFRPDFKGAIADCRKTLATQPDSVAAKIRLAALLWHHGGVDEAAALLEQLLAADESNGAANYFLGLVRATNRDPARARHFLERASALRPRDVNIEAALANLDAVQPVDRGAATKRVALHFKLPYHFQILKPVFDALKPGHVCLITPHVSELYAFEPDVVVVAESNAPFLREKLPDAVFVSTRHGLISKHTAAYGARVTDYLCLTSADSRDWFIRNGGRPRRDFWITGYSQMDKLFRPVEIPLEVEIDPGRKIVLYAPTWTPGLSSADMLDDQAVDLIRGRRTDVTLLIKPHPVTALHRPEWIETWRRLAASDDHVHLFDDPACDVMPFLKNADVLVTDTSSVMLQYLAVDRPIVLITNPARHGLPHFDPSGIEWLWRDMGREIHDVADLASAVSDALDDPGLGAAERAGYRRALFGELTDGRASERIARKITELVL